MHYEIEMVYQKEDMQALTRASVYSQKSMKILSGLSSVLFRITGIIILLMGSLGMFDFINNLFTQLYPLNFIFPFFSIIFVLLGLYLIIRSSNKLWGNSLARIIWKHYPGKGETIKYVFDAGIFAIYSFSGEHHYYYTTIQKLYEDDQRLFLFVNKADAHTIIKSAFVDGDFNSFKQFIMEKTALPVINIK